MPKNPFARHERSDGTDAVGGVHHATPRYGERYQASGGKPSGRARRSGRAAERTAEPSLLARTVNQWWNRLLGAVYSRSFSEQSEQYMTRSPGSTSISARRSAISSSEKNFTMGLVTEPSSRKAM